MMDYELYEILTVVAFPILIIYLTMDERQNDEICEINLIRIGSLFFFRRSYYFRKSINAIWLSFMSWEIELHRDLIIVLLDILILTGFSIWKRQVKYRT